MHLAMNLYLKKNNCNANDSNNNTAFTSNNLCNVFISYDHRLHLVAMRNISFRPLVANNHRAETNYVNYNNNL